MQSSAAAIAWHNAQPCVSSLWCPPCSRPPFAVYPPQMGVPIMPRKSSLACVVRAVGGSHVNRGANVLPSIQPPPIGSVLRSAPNTHTTRTHARTHALVTPPERTAGQVVCGMQAGAGRALAQQEQGATRGDQEAFDSAQERNWRWLAWGTHPKLLSLVLETRGGALFLASCSLFADVSAPSWPWVRCCNVER